MTKVDAFAAGDVRGFLHRAEGAPGPGLILAHGAGSNCGAPLLVAVADAFAAAGVSVLRCDLPFRQHRRTGPPGPGDAAKDREGLRHAVDALGKIAGGPVFLGGHSYGGRQASMLAADHPDLAAALLLLSYPLHPPTKPEQLRTAHFPKLKTRAIFVHGTKDSFGTIDELEKAVALIPAATRILPVEGAGHDLKSGRFDIGSAVKALLG